MASRISATLDVAATISVLVASVVVTVLAIGMRARPHVESSPDRIDQELDLKEVLPIEERSATTPARRAPILLLEFTDFQCPYCGQFARDTLPILRRQFIADRKIDLVVRNFPLDRIHPMAVQAAQAAECARTQGKYWEMYDRLFARQDTLNDENLVDQAHAIGADTTTFASCMRGEALDALTEDRAVAKKMGVNSTPTFFVGRVETDGRVRFTRKITGASPYSVFRTALGEAGMSRLAP